MALRSRHLACLFLLLSTMGASQASASRSQSRFYGDRISAILYRHAADVHSEHLAQKPAATAADETLLIPAPCRAAFHSTWTMRPPAAHSAAVCAVTSFARSSAL